MRSLELDLLDRPRHLISLLRNTDPGVLQATQHPNGFLKITLLQVSHLGPSLRLHVWSNQEAAESSNVHNHRWRLDSRILCGVLRAEYFVLDSHGKDYYSWRYRENNETVLEANGRTSLRLMAQQLITAGSIYHLPADVLHRVTIASQGQASTLVIRGVVERPWADVYSKTSKPASQSSDQVASPRIVEEQISLAVELLSEVAK